MATMVSSSNQPLVSVICNTYNHARYIHRALDGFLMQQTDFPYEILIHEDASTDETATILRQYEQAHPQRLNVIYQTENQYSQGKSVNAMNIARARGKYLAFCEGDDLWIDPFKLQKQMDVVRNDPSITLVVHASLVRNVNNPFAKRLWSFSDHSRVLSLEEIILKRGIVAAHSSYFFLNQTLAYPAYFNNIGVLDTTRLIYHALHGKVMYLSDVMSVYQVGVAGSWNERIRMNDDKMIKHYRRELDFYEALEHDLDRRAIQEVQQVKAQINAYIEELIRRRQGSKFLYRLRRWVRGIIHYWGV